MAQQAKISQQEVDAICARLLLQGKVPTVRLIRAEHGAGSTGTIQRFLRVWESGQPNIETGITLSSALQKALADNLGYEVSKAKQDLLAKLTAADETIADLSRENEQLVEGLARAEDEVAQVKTEFLALKEQTAKLEADLVGARAAEHFERDDADHLRAELAKAHLRIEQAEQLEHRYNQLQGQYDAERGRREKAEKAAAISEAQRDGLAERLSDERHRSDQLATQIDKLSKELTQAAVRVEAAHGRFEDAANRLASAREAEKTAQQSEKIALTEAAELRGELRILLERYNALVADTNNDTVKKD